MKILNCKTNLIYFLIFLGIIFPSITNAQTKTDAELYAIWKDKSKPETVRLEAIWERMDIDSLPNQEPEWWKKWKSEMKEAIELAVKNNKKGYLPLFYMSTLESYYGNNDSLCITAKKVIETAKVANASKAPFVLYAYFALYYNHCVEDVKDADVLNEFNKVKFESPRLQMCSYLNQAKYGKGVWKNFNSIPKNSRLNIPIKIDVFSAKTMSVYTKSVKLSSKALALMPVDFGLNWCRRSMVWRMVLLTSLKMSTSVTTASFFIK